MEGNEFCHTDPDLKKSTMTTNDIAYLLGYQELNSFLRAFIVWRGISVSEYRAQNEH